MSLTAKLKPWLKQHIRKLPMLEKALRFLMAKSVQWEEWKFTDFIKRKAFSRGIIICKVTQTAKIEKFIKRFCENYVSVDLIRIGGDADGGYLIPNIFDRIAYCLSPGVADTADFEVELSRRYDIKSFMIDGSVASAPFANENFHFTKKFLGHRTSGNFITLSDWMDSVLDAGGGDNNGMILQMDIEGGEYDVLTFESTATLSRFAAMIIEFHHLERFFGPHFLYMTSILFEKLYRNFAICHVHPNNNCGVTSLNGIDMPNVIEVTFLRHDLVDKFKSASALSLPHPLDRKNVSHKPDIGMPKIWWNP